MCQANTRSGWSDILDPGLFAQALMYYSSKFSSLGWPGEPEIDPTRSDPRILGQGEELSPARCLELAYEAVLDDDDVLGGTFRA